MRFITYVLWRNKESFTLIISVTPPYLDYEDMFRTASGKTIHSRTSVARTLMARFTTAVSNSLLSPLEKSHSCRF